LIEKETLFKTFRCSGAAVGYLKDTFLKSIDFYKVKLLIGSRQSSIIGFLSITLNMVLPASLAAYIP